MKHQPLYREILRQAWKITWHQRMLWVWGLFSVLIVGTGAFDVFSRQIERIFTPRPMWGGWHRMAFSWSLDWPGRLWLVALCLLCLGLLAFLIFMSVRSFASLIKGASIYKEGEKLDMPKVWESTSFSFWPVLGTIVFGRALIYSLGVISAWPLWLVLVGKFNLFWLIAYPLFLIGGLVLSMICAFLVTLTSTYIVLKKRTWPDAVADAWQLFTEHWLVCLELAGVLFLVGSAAIILTLAVAIILNLPTILVILFSLAVSFPPLAKTFLAIGLVLTTALVLWMAGVVSTFYTVTWTLLFQRMEKRVAFSKLARWFDLLKNRFVK